MPTPATGAVEWVRLEEIWDDTTFRLRDSGDVSDLATSMGRLGQLAPVELRLRPGVDGEGPCWQVVAGFRRVEALRLLRRDRVMARLHERLEDEDAWALALSHALLSEPLTMTELEALRERLEVAGVAAWAGDLIDDAQVRAPVAPELRERFHAFLRQPQSTEVGGGLVPRGSSDREREAVEELADAPETDEIEPGEEADEIEVTPEELGGELLRRFVELNQDLALAFEAWDALPVAARRQILAQARYVAELFPFLQEKAR